MYTNYPLRREVIPDALWLRVLAGFVVWRSRVLARLRHTTLRPSAAYGSSEKFASSIKIWLNSITNLAHEWRSLYNDEEATSTRKVSLSK